MERKIEQMASVTELLTGLSSPDASDDDRQEMQRRLQKLKSGPAS
jgi:hypothetical protein